MNTFRPSIFRSFWMGGFESACHINEANVRLDMLQARNTIDSSETIMRRYAR